MPPRALPYIEQLVLVGYRVDYADSDAAGGDGVALVEFDVPSDETWLVDRVAVINTSTMICAASVYVGGLEPRNYRADTELGNRDSAEGTPIYVEPTSSVLVQWTRADPGSVGTAVIEYRVMAHRGSFGG